MRPDNRTARSTDALLLESIRHSRMLVVSMLLCLILSSNASAQTAPVLTTIFPCGGQMGTTFEVTVNGTLLDAAKSLQSNISGFTSELIAPNKFRVTIPGTALPGSYDLWAAGEHGLSNLRTIQVGRLPEVTETEPNDSSETSSVVSVDKVINGQLDKSGDVDWFRFEATAGQRIIVELSAERIDSRLRAVLEVLDSEGRRIAVNRGYFGIDPLIDFHVPKDGQYFLRVQDLIAGGGPEFYYRLELNTQPRILFSQPSIIQQGVTSQVTLFGWNLPHSQVASSQSANGIEQMAVEIPAAMAVPSHSIPVHLQSFQAVSSAAAFPFYLDGSHGPLMIGLSDLPVSSDRTDNHSPEAARKISVPAVISGQLADASEQDWFSVDVLRGEVLHLDAFGQRIASPVDLQLSIHDSAGHLLTQFNDAPENTGDEFPTNHLDPSGRWVCPRDGRFYIVVRNLNRGSQHDPRRIYQLDVRREEPDFQIVAVPSTKSPEPLNIQRGGRTMLTLLAERRRGFDGAIRVVARELPPGVECSDVWFGPGVNEARLSIEADPGCEPLTGELKLEAFGDAEFRELRHDVQFGTIVRSGLPNGWGRLLSMLPLAVTDAAPIRITTNAHETLEHQLYGTLLAKHFQGGAVDVAVEVERHELSHEADVRLTAEGLPKQIRNQTALIPAGQSQGYITFELPLTLAPGHYSFLIRAETTAPMANGKAEKAVAYSAPMVIDVQPAAFEVDVDPLVVRKAHRGDTIQIAYSARRKNGFIGKMHTELAAPGVVTDVPGLLGRGETFTGQTETGSLQVVVNPDAPLGLQPFLRLFTVGVVEDEPVYYGSRFLSLEIVE